MKVIFFEEKWQIGIWSKRHKKYIVYTFDTEKEALDFYKR